MRLSLINVGKVEGAKAASTASVLIRKSKKGLHEKRKSVSWPLPR
jgi:hypothetical protein